MWDNSRAVLEKNLPSPPHQQPLLLMGTRQSLTLTLVKLIKSQITQLTLFR